jgi:Tfp pilus assembly protein PilF
MAQQHEGETATRGRGARPWAYRRAARAGSVVAALVLGGAGVAWAEDYFTTHLDPTRLNYRQTVESFHVDRVPDLIRQGRMRDAKAELIYTLERFPNHPRALILLEVVGPLLNDASLAVNYYQNALKNHPQYVVIRTQYGMHLVDLGLVEAGIDQIKQAIDLDDSFALAHAALARAYAKAGQADLAREAASRAAALGHEVQLPEPSTRRSGAADPAKRVGPEETKSR